MSSLYCPYCGNQLRGDAAGHCRHCRRTFEVRHDEAAVRRARRFPGVAIAVMLFWPIVVGLYWMEDITSGRRLGDRYVFFVLCVIVNYLYLARRLYMNTRIDAATHASPGKPPSVLVTLIQGVASVLTFLIFLAAMLLGGCVFVLVKGDLMRP